MNSPPLTVGGSRVRTRRSARSTLGQTQQSRPLVTGIVNQQNTTSQPPEYFKRLIPNIDELWDPNLPMALNIARVVSGDTAPVPPGQPQSFEPLFRGSANDETMFTQAEDHDAGSDGDFEDIVRVLRGPAPHNLQSPLLALQHQVATVFRHGPLRARAMYASLSFAAEFGGTEVDIPICNLPILPGWNSCKRAATLVGILACPSQRLYEVLKFQSGHLGGLPSFEEIHNTPSTSLQTAFRKAKMLARGKQGVSSVLVVSLVDVHIFELVKEQKASDYTTFAHVLVLGIGPEGVIVWQGWGEHGYGLDQWIKKGDARVRTWQEAGDFVSDFEAFAAYEGEWDAKRNKVYKKCFDVDIVQTCGEDGPSRPIVPKVKSWVRILAMEDLKLDDIYKFQFV